MASRAIHDEAQWPVIEDEAILNAVNLHIWRKHDPASPSLAGNRQNTMGALGVRSRLVDRIAIRGRGYGKWSEHYAIFLMNIVLPALVMASPPLAATLENIH